MRVFFAAIAAITLVAGSAGQLGGGSAAQAGGRDIDGADTRRLRRDAIGRLARPRTDALRGVDRRMMPGATNSLGQPVPSLTLPAPDNPAGAGHRPE